MRKEYSAKNFITSLIPFFILAVLGFVRIDVFINMLGVETYALNQLFFQLFAYMSLIEAGAGILITQKYYPLLVNKDKDEINKVYTSSIKILKRVSVIMFITGIVVSYGLEFLTNNHLNLWYMQIVFMLFIIRSITEYLTLSPRLVLQADQKIYKINVLFNFYKIAEASFEIWLLYLGLDYIAILISSILFRVVSYYAVNSKIYQEYKWLKKVKLNNYQPIKGLKYVFSQRLASAVSDNTTILLISAFLSPLKVTMYSSYNYILKFITDLIGLFVNAISASLGNVMYKENSRDRKDIFEELNAIFFFGAIFFATTIYFVIDSFVTLWIGGDKVIDSLSLALLIFILFHNIARKPLLTIKNVNGLFKETQTIALTEAGIILLLSIPLIQLYGVPGALIATVISYLTTNFWFYPNYIYKNVFEANPKEYYLKYGFAFTVTLLICHLTTQLNLTSNIDNFLLWFSYAAVYSIIIFIVLVVGGLSTSKYLRRIIGKIFIIIKGRKENEKSN